MADTRELTSKLRIARELVAACLESDGSWLNDVIGSEARDAYFETRERLAAALDSVDDVRRLVAE
jgi:hypothetical protein